MELRQLRYFIVVAEEAHVTRAAARLFITQPALSRQIRKLEVRVGARLFDRTVHGVRLTPAGRVLLDHAHGILRAVDEARSAVRKAAT